MRSIRLKSIQITILITYLSLVICPIKAQTNSDYPNILLIISDDLGVDVSNGYHQGNMMPNTPTLDSLRRVGITFENVWATPKCTPTRAAMMSGKYGIKTGILRPPGNLDLNHTSIFKELFSQTNGQYADALIGKWHISQPSNPSHPIEHGADYFMGVLGSGVNDYYSWSRTENDNTNIDDTYVTKAFTNAGIEWINAQTKSWFLWMAHVAPHSPFHIPPPEMYTIASTGGNFRKYLAMIESVDFEIDRLLKSIPADVRDNTVIIYIGDNGTPGNLIQDYPAGHGKGSLYQGGIRVPMIVAGAGVSRQGVREPALIHALDIYATVLEIAGAELPGGMYNSLSFNHLLTNETGPTRDYVYSELSDDNVDGWTIRNQQYKLINYADGTQEFFDLIVDSLEFNNLLTESLNSSQQQIKADLQIEAAQIRTGWSCRDHIQNGDEEGIDCGGSSCNPCMTTNLNTAIENLKLTVYPNPGSNILNISSRIDPIDEIKIFTSMGELVFARKNIRSTESIFDIQSLSSQVYFVQVCIKNRVQVVKFVKQ